MDVQLRKVDNGYLVAWEGHMDYKISKASSGIINSVLSGEGFVCTFTGPGRIYLQTRSVPCFAHVLAPYVAPSGGGGAAFAMA
jgi:uncharacterized protein (AIM24 family)